MAIIKVALFFFVAVMLAFVVAGVLLTHARFFIYIGVIGLLVYVVYALVKRQGST